jgi:hypothetical protein
MFRNAVSTSGLLVLWIVVTVGYQFLQLTPRTRVVYDRLLFYSVAALIVGLFFGLLVRRSHNRIWLGVFGCMIFLWTAILEWQLGRSTAIGLALFVHGFVAMTSAMLVAYVALLMRR